MGLLDKVKASAEQAASSAQKQAQIVATKRELSQAYGDLGKTAFGLVDRGELGHGDLRFQLAEVGAETVVQALAERQVPVGVRTAQVELIGPAERGGVAARGGQPQEDAGAFG